MINHDDKPGFGEAGQRSFALDDAIAFQDLMLGIYGASCAVTGKSEQGVELFLFQPLSHGGQMVAGNAVVVEPAVASLLSQGLLLISDDFSAYTPHPELVGVAITTETQRGRHIRLPEATSHWPDKAMLAYHRSLFRAQ
ncbi:hypothetical protein [Devosia sediminis]|uniref:Uncharacterized protein n=1 Tax=Devosia sediminis TaxID=2798801 RepID=A0A934MK60_9HYPH|nr:hypothetical protein [Devosia sediminis]MBJ3783196.1 hypothetical protein [Devosia sediminis]